MLLLWWWKVWFPLARGKYSDHGSTRRARRAATSRGVVSSWRTGPDKHSRCEFVTGDVGEGLVQSNVARSTVLSEQYFCDGRCLLPYNKLLPNALGKADRKGSSVQSPKRITAEKRMSWPTTAGKNSHRKVSLLTSAGWRAYQTLR